MKTEERLSKIAELAQQLLNTGSDWNMDLYPLKDLAQQILTLALTDHEN